MNLNSRLFDSIRVKPSDDPTPGPKERGCDHAGCRNSGLYRAPKGRYREGQFHHFCLEHVRAYNATYNYFAGMPDDDVAAYQRDALTGHRPTWKMGVNSARNPGDPAAATKPGQAPDYVDPLDVFGLGGYDPRRRARAPAPEKPTIGKVAAKAMEVLGVDPGTPGPDIKARYKELVKRLHPDANGGDRSNEDRLREIIKAYNVLRTSGMV